MKSSWVLPAVRYGIAAVWLFFGLFAKVLGLIPRHRLIVARVLGERLSGPVTKAVGVAEILVAIWVVSGRAPILCASAVSLALVGMNTVEIAKARDLLLSPGWMVFGNALLVAAIWMLALSAASPGMP